MNENTLLRDATVQDIQLELLRRTCFNAMDGNRIVRSLLNIAIYGYPRCWTARKFHISGNPVGFWLTG
jgi:hypothetical protein